MGSKLAMFVFVLLLTGLVLRNWNGANTLLGTGIKGGNTFLATLEQR